MLRLGSNNTLLKVGLQSVQRACMGADIVYIAPISTSHDYSADNLSLTSANSILSALQPVSTSQTITFSSYTATLINASEEALSLVYDAINKGWTIAGTGLNLKTFSVASGKVVAFSSGNLQYKASTDEWRFAPNQYDVIGSANSNISETYDGWIDLFGWGTSGYNCCYPYLHTTNNSDYGPASGDIAGTEYDWGVHNVISGYEKGTFRTLTKDEWTYIYSGRTNAIELFTLGNVDGSNGLILLPDNWDDSIELVMTTDNYTSNTLTQSKWLELHNKGCVFLPCAGRRKNNTVNSVNYNGDYSSSTHFWENWCYELGFYTKKLTISTIDRSVGISVRLVRDVNS